MKSFLVASRYLVTKKRQNVGTLILRELCEITKAAPKSDAAVAALDNSVWSWVPPSKQLPPKLNIAAIEKDRVYEEQERTIASPASRSHVSLISAAAAVINDADVIPVKINTLLTSREIVTALTKMGAIDVKVVSVAGKLDSVEDFIIVSGSSTRHIRKMSQAIVQALKSRKLTKTMGYTGAEGARDDDWLLVDCQDRVVHLMLPNTRKALKLEEHWAEGNKRPVVVWSANEQEYEANFNKLLEKHPVPEEWDEQDDKNVSALSGVTKEHDLKKHGTHLGEL